MFSKFTRGSLTGKEKLDLRPYIESLPNAESYKLTERNFDPYLVTYHVHAGFPPQCITSSILILAENREELSKQIKGVMIKLGFSQYVIMSCEKCSTFCVSEDGIEEIGKGDDQEWLQKLWKDPTLN